MKTHINLFLEALNRSPKTVFAYRNGLLQFVKVVGEAAELNTETYIKFLISMQNKSSSTQRVYRTAVLKFYAFCKVGNWVELKEASEHYVGKPSKHIVRFDRKAVEKVIEYSASLQGDLEALRDRAFVLTLVDTGLRISEACSLKRSEVNWTEKYAIIKGIFDYQTIIHFSNRAIDALDAYLQARSSVEPNSRKPIGAQPLFARHDIRASKQIRPITAGGMWKAIKSRIEETGLERSAVRIHDFRHYFVTTTYLAKRDLKLSQTLARHASVSTTNRYAHFGNEDDVAYDEIFNSK
jgi:site-specific recombinase XerD